MIKKYKVKFCYTPPISSQPKVFLTGSFNDWKENEIELQETAGTYEVSIELKSGRYAYKFIVNDLWIADGNSDSYEDDGRGGRNSIIEIGENLKKLYYIPIEYCTKRKIKSLSIAGTFNNWNHKYDTFRKVENLSIKKRDKYQIILLLPEGEYEYKFVVNDKMWIEDPNNSNKKADGNGGYNSLLVVNNECQIYTGDKNEIITFGIFNEFFPRGEFIDSQTMRISCRTYKKNVKQISAILGSNSFLLKNYFSDDIWEYFSVQIDRKFYTKKFQLFLSNDKDEKTCIHSNFVIKKNETNLEWIQKGVFYQIFCDRFCNGNSEINPDFNEWYYSPQKNKLSPAVRQQQYFLEKDWSKINFLKENSAKKHSVFYGGDLFGVREKLPYLKDIGVTIIYFNPLVKSESNHKYDTYDYFSIDPHFGENSEFKILVQEAHQKGISIILDFAFNHVGVGFFAFQDCLKNGKNSEYSNWFDCHQYPLPEKIPDDFKASDYYQCWWGHATLPDLNYDLDRQHPAENYISDIKDANVNKPLVDYLLKVVEFWLIEMDIDGFRLDVPNEVPFWFWKLFKDKVKFLKPNAYLIGEIWHNATEWLDNYFDAVMNYSYFREPVLQYFALQNWSTEKFVSVVLEGLHHYGFCNLSLMMNLLDSHDTHRFLESAIGDIRKLKLALIFQMTWIGTPHIFYGDEVGLMGGNDPDNRRPMNWDFYKNQKLSNLHDFYKKIISIRKANSVLIFGEVEIIHSKQNVLVYKRSLLKEEIFILINNSEETKQIDLFLDGEFTEIISQKNYKPKQGKLRIQIPSLSGLILKKQLVCKN